MVQGLFITFEGPDGGGKTTQLHLLKHVLSGRGLSVMSTREPGGTSISDHIRRILLDPANKEMNEKTETLLYAASRAQHVSEKIKPALQQGQIVLCDRFVDASMAYQGFGLGVGEEQVRALNDFATGGLTPDRTYLLDIPPEMGLARMNDRQNGEFEQELDRIEQRDRDYHQKVRKAFENMAWKEERIVLIEATQSADNIHKLIVEDIDKLLVSHA